jgi:excisionase family DNA binding protein
MANITADTIEDRVKRMQPVSTPPSERDTVIELSNWMQGNESRLGLVLEGDKDVRELPLEVALLFERVIEAMARGESVSVVSVPNELTTQQAADILNVSRQYLARLLDEGRIPSRRIGTHRRVHATDVLAFKRERDAERRKALRKLTQLTEELGGYEAELKES